MSEELKNKNKENGENRCPKCGASDVTYNVKKKKLICNYCYTEFDAESLEGIEKEVKNLKGVTRTEGTADIKENAEDVITLKCSGCGAEVVINTTETMNARCHWCRSILSINSQIENGSVPDAVLPFTLSREQAKEKIDQFVGKRKFFANNTFKKEFTTNNIMGAYFPYLLIDANCHGHFQGEGGEVARSYQISKGKNSRGEEEYEEVYDINLYHVEREFDITIDDLSIESSEDKLDKNNKTKTTNVINSIMPFDTENCVKYKANYLVGYSSEKRDINVSNIEEKVNYELRDIARHALNSDLKKYNSGVEWKQETFAINGKQWVSAYLPVWLYSYQTNKNKLHYIAVNGRTGETMGSVPINEGKLAIISILVFALSVIIPYLFQLLPVITGMIGFTGFISALIFYFAKKSEYRNKGARHQYELETKNQLNITKRKDEFIRVKKECSTRTLAGSNNKRIEGEHKNINK